MLAQGSNGDGHVISVATLLSKTRPATLKLFRCAKISAGMFARVVVGGGSGGGSGSCSGSGSGGDVLI